MNPFDLLSNNRLLAELPLLTPTFWGVVNGIVWVFGLIALLIMLIVILLFVSMLPDFGRYLKIKRM